MLRQIQNTQPDASLGFKTPLRDLKTPRRKPIQSVKTTIKKPTTTKKKIQVFVDPEPIKEEEMEMEYMPPNTLDVFVPPKQDILEIDYRLPQMKPKKGMKAFKQAQQLPELVRVPSPELDLSVDLVIDTEVDLFIQ